MASKGFSYGLLSFFGQAGFSASAAGFSGFFLAAIAGVAPNMATAASAAASFNRSVTSDAPYK
jgi:hypothetical protein